MGNKTWLRTVKWLMAGCLISFVSGCSLLPKEEQGLRPPLVKPAQENRETAEVQRGTVSKRINGVAVFTSTNVEYAQFNEAGGKISSVNVKAGDKVKKGDLLVQLLTNGLDLKLKEQSLAFEKAKVALVQAKKQTDPDSIKLRSMELDIEETRLEAVKQQAENRKLVAQSDGQVIFVDNVKPGDTVDAYRNLVSIANPKQMRLEYQAVNAKDLLEVQVGMDIKVKLGKVYIGTVVQTPSSAPIVENKQLADKYAKSLYMELKELPPDAALGKTAEFTVITMQKDNTLKIPSRGLRNYAGRNYVQMLDGDSLREVDVEKGIESSTEVEILQGLKEGDKVVLQ